MWYVKEKQSLFWKKERKANLLSLQGCGISGCGNSSVAKFSQRVSGAFEQRSKGNVCKTVWARSKNLKLRVTLNYVKTSGSNHGDVAAVSCHGAMLLDYCPYLIVNLVHLSISAVTCAEVTEGIHNSRFQEPCSAHLSSFAVCVMPLNTLGTQNMEQM